MVYIPRLWHGYITDDFGNEVCILYTEKAESFSQYIRFLIN